MVLDEVFSQREYAPPDPVASSLNALRPLRVADLGANIGAFGAWVFANYPDAQVVAFEPDQGNAAVHERAIAANDLAERWRLVRYVAAERAGRARAAGGDWTTATFEPSESGEIEAVDVFPYLREVDLLKIDIEGGEWAIMEDERFASVPARALVLEYHVRGCPDEDPQAAAAAALRDAGFTVFAGVSKPRFGAGLLWGLRPVAMRATLSPCTPAADRRSRSASTTDSTSSENDVFGSQPSSVRAFAGSPTRWSTSAGRRKAGSVTTCCSQSRPAWAGEAPVALGLPVPEPQLVS